MAEMLRRQTEAAHAVQLPEEDELGFGWPSQDMKLHRYGNNRLLDGDSAPVNEFLRASNLDYGLRARWYVEGHTEYYAACYGCEQLGADHVELINLQGEVAQRGGKGVAFRQNLRNDVANGIFSYISVDDENNYAKAVRKAAEDDEICGLFAIATPDFEFHNFTLSELEEVLWSIAEDNGISPEVRPRLHAAIAKTKNATELLTVAGQVSPELNIKKGKVWGERLMAYALEHRGGRDGHIRPVIDILEDAHRTTHYSYHYIRTHTRINPLTGRPIDRNPADK